jgi:hypothetical protein
VEPSDTRLANRSAVLARLLAAGTTTRAAVTRSTGLSLATVSRVIEQLLEENLVKEGAEVASSRRGRNAVSIEVAAGHAWCAASALVPRTVASF